MPCYLSAGNPSTLCHISTRHSLSALMGIGEVATSHQVARTMAFHRGEIILEISNRMEQNAVVCQAVNPSLNFDCTCSFCVCPFNLALAKAAGTRYLEGLQLLTSCSRTPCRCVLRVILETHFSRARSIQLWWIFCILLPLLGELLASAASREGWRRPTF